MRKPLIILIVLFSVFLAIGCAGTETNQSEPPAGSPTPVLTETPTIAEPSNETETPEQTATPVQTIPEPVAETTTAEITSAELVPPTEEATESQSATETQPSTVEPTLKEFTPEELAQYNGENGMIYVAYQGEVYDVSDSKYLWKNGSHHGCRAGTDITEEMDKTPHGSEILKSFPLIGTLKK
jgi:predicted heme/steroid binding protein